MFVFRPTGCSTCSVSVQLPQHGHGYGLSLRDWNGTEYTAWWYCICFGLKKKLFTFWLSLKTQNYIFLLKLFCHPKSLIVKWTVFILLFSSPTNNWKHITTQVSIHPFTHTHTYSYTGGRCYHARHHLLIGSDNHSHTDGRVIGGNLEFSFVPKDTSTCRLQGLGIKPRPSEWWTTAVPSEQPLH